MNGGKSELEEAIKICRNLIDSLGTGLVKFGGIDLGSKDIGYIQAIKTLLQALENSIPKKNIEDKYKDMKKQYEEELEKNSIKAFTLKCKIEILEEVLENK